jgi:aminoglycoside phosphotransferase (APT) family kinase protein
MGDALVRKRIDDDCLLDGDLHPAIAERLARVRELPVTSVAMLRAVERDEQGVWLVWQHIEGTTLEQLLATSPTEAELQRIRRELRLVLGAMHAHGIVHGGIHARNVIIDPQGNVRVTHVSPLLYADPQEDLDAVEELFENRAEPGKTHVLPDRASTAADRKLRAKAYAAAAGSVVIGVVMFIVILWYVRA